MTPEHAPDMPGKSFFQNIAKTMAATRFLVQIDCTSYVNSEYSKINARLTRYINAAAQYIIETPHTLKLTQRALPPDFGNSDFVWQTFHKPCSFSESCRLSPNG